MAYLEIDGVRYPIPEKYTYAEMDVLQTVAKVKGLTDLIEALEARNTNAQIALAMVVLERAGIKADKDKLMALELGAITSGEDEPEAEDEQIPPAVAVEEAAPANGVPTLTAIPSDTREVFGAPS